MKILINCCACSPFKGSEPGMGWNFLKEISKEHDVTAIVTLNFKDDIEKYLKESREDINIKFYYVKEVKHNIIYKIYPPEFYWMYKKWQKDTYKLALELCKKEKFDIIHQLNMVGYREPGYLWKIKDIPFVWGPIGGFNITPWQMLLQMGLYGTLFYGCRNIINLWQMYTMSRVKKAMKRANAIIAATQDCKDRIKSLYKKDSTIIPEVGTVEHDYNEIPKRNDNEPLKICWSGQHTPGKSLNLLIEALSINKNLNIELHIIGNGRETKKWQVLAKKLGLKNLIWYSWVQRSQALEIMKRSHLFVITSMSDLTSTVLLEALSYGLPVIAMDHCGFSNVINGKCGIKIPIKNKKQVVEDLQKAIEFYYNNETERFNASQNAKLRSNDYKWDNKLIILNEVYQKAIEDFKKKDTKQD